jgi:peptide/nickel transport system permease protein
MLGYALKRILAAIPLILGLLTVTFFIVHLAPGDPTAIYLTPEIDPKVADQLREKFGLNDPVYVQYFKWLWSILHGEFGVSFSMHRPVLEIVSSAIPNTLLLTSLALLFEIVIGIIIGVISAIRKGTWLDNGLTVGALFAYSIPEFWLGLMLISILSLKLGILPSSQMHSVDSEYLPLLPYVWDTVKHLVLPVFVLGVANSASMARYVRGSMVEVIHQDYIITARAKGLSELSVVWRHALRNALLPVVTIVGLSLPFLFSGAVVVETIFAWPGMGRITVDAIFARDYPLIIANTLLIGILVVMGNLLADLVYGLVDPRIRIKR